MRDRTANLGGATAQYPSSVTVITGGTRGISAAVARRPAANGHALVLGYAHDHAAAANLRDELADAQVEIADRGIRVVGVAPGMTYTRIHADAGDPDRLAKVVARVPLGRVGTPTDVAARVAWLLTAEASYITGTTIRVAGGL